MAVESTGRTGLWRSLAVLIAVTIAAACGSSSSTTATRKAQTIDVTLSDDGCEPRSIPATEGPVTFKVSNDGTKYVTEFEILADRKILGEVENVMPDTDRSFSLELAAGSYTTHCPGGQKFDSGTLEVASAATGPAANQADRTAAVNRYLAYVKGEADQLIPSTTAFAAAVKAGNADQAKQLFASARYHYEAIEPIAESFGDLDPDIDARAGDVPDNQWGGFHRIEKALWADNSLAGMGPVADKLVADVTRLRSLLDDEKLDPGQVANGAVELLNEVSVSKVTGEEDRYSHTDLSDFAGNLAGAKAAFEALKPLLQAKQADLATQLEQRFADVQTLLETHKGGDPTGNGYVLYSSLTPDDTRALSAKVDTLAEPLSKVAAIVLL